MTDVDALTAFIRARLADEEAWARASDGESWRGEHKDVWTLSGDRKVATARSAAAARHIARQDPAATLARVAAMRALVDHHAQGHLCISRYDEDRWYDPDDICLAKRHIGAIWASHVDYRAEWAPSVTDG